MHRVSVAAVPRQVGSARDRQGPPRAGLRRGAARTSATAARRARTTARCARSTRRSSPPRSSASCSRRHRQTCSPTASSGSASSATRARSCATPTSAWPRRSASSRRLSIADGTGPESVPASRTRRSWTPARSASPKQGARKKLGLDPLPPSGGDAIAQAHGMRRRRRGVRDEGEGLNGVRTASRADADQPSCPRSRIARGSSISSVRATRGVAVQDPRRLRPHGHLRRVGRPHERRERHQRDGRPARPRQRARRRLRRLRHLPGVPRPLLLPHDVSRHRRRRRRPRPSSTSTSSSISPSRCPRVRSRASATRRCCGATSSSPTRTSSRWPR